MTKIAFHTHWQELLHGYFLRRQNEAFLWGTMDCCLFACDAVRELTDVDLAADFRGKYDSLLSAVRVMKKFVAEPFTAKDAKTAKKTPEEEMHLVELVAEKIAAQFAIEEVPVMMAQRGDVLLLDSPLGKGLGILGLRGTHVHCAGPDGVVDVPLHECFRAWRIPKFAPVPPEATIPPGPQAQANQ
jgi:Domain of unknown function (DUF6950)